MRVRRRSRVVTSAVCGLLLVVLGACSTPRTDPAPAPSASTSAPPTAARPASPVGSAPFGGRTVTGDITGVHDPGLVIAADGTWWVYSTGQVHRGHGGTIQIWSSPDHGTTWKYAGTVWHRIPAWIDAYFAGSTPPDNLWAPEVHEHDGTYYLYYSASSFGSDHSLTALATNTTLDPGDPHYRWVDRGLVVASPVEGLDPDHPGTTFNAIDPGVVEDAGGHPYLAIGSFWNGIFVLPLQWPSGKPVRHWQARTVNVADRQRPGDPVEAAVITRHGGYFYLFVSFDLCCRGAQSTYKVAVGRASSVQGPYTDRSGRDLMHGGGTVLLAGQGERVGPGGQSVSGDYLAFHYYDGTDAADPYVPTLGIQHLGWVDGWPTVGHG